MSDGVKDKAERAGRAIENAAPNAVRVVGEVFVPGVSLLLNGEVKGGLLHLAGGVVGRAIIGPLGWFWAAADSYSVSTTGKHFHQHFVGLRAERT